MALSRDQFMSRIEDVLGQLELQVLDGLEELSYEAMEEMPKRTPLELLKAQRALLEARRSLKHPEHEMEALR